MPKTTDAVALNDWQVGFEAFENKSALKVILQP